MWCLSSVSVPCPVGNRRVLIVGISCGLLAAPVVPLGGWFVGRGPGIVVSGDKGEGGDTTGLAGGVKMGG